jgi:hypothetical protein
MLSGTDVKEQHMDWVRSTVRLITQAALVTTAVSERVTAAMLRCIIDRVDRLLQPGGIAPGAHDIVAPAPCPATPSEKARR